MAKINELLEEYRAYQTSLAEYEETRKVDQTVDGKIKDLRGKIDLIKAEISKLRGTEAKKVWETIDQSRFSYDIAQRSETIDRGSLGDLDRDYNASVMSIHVMGLKIPVSEVDIGYETTPLMGDAVLKLGAMNPKRASGALLSKFELDPVGTKKAVCETVRVKAMKDAASIPQEIKMTEKQLRELISRRESIKKLLDEEVPDNAIMRKIFKKKFEAIANAPKDLALVDSQIAELTARKENLEYRLNVANSLNSPEAIEQYVESEYEYFKAFVERDWEKEVGSTSSELTEEIVSIEDEIKKAVNSRPNCYGKQINASRLKDVFEKDFSAIMESFGDKTFIEELRSIDLTKLPEEERRIVEVVKDKYEQHMAKAIQKYEE